MKSYTDLDNPTGIYVNSGDELIVMVGDTYGNTIRLQAIRSSNLSGDKYMLNEGINKLQMKGDGMLFVMYNTELTSENAKPVKIHIPFSGLFPPLRQSAMWINPDRRRADTAFAESP